MHCKNITVNYSTDKYSTRVQYCSVDVPDLRLDFWNYIFIVPYAAISIKIENDKWDSRTTLIVLYTCTVMIVQNIVQSSVVVVL